MTHSADREPLLRQNDDDVKVGDGSDGFELIMENMEFYTTNPSQLFNGKKEKLISKVILLVIVVLLSSVAIDEYNESMKVVEMEECNDVLSDCSHLPFNETVVPPFYNYLQDFTISPRYDISLCLIPKVISTIGTATICYIEDPVSFSENNRTISNEMYTTRYCEKNEMKSFKMVKHHLNPNFKNIIVTRDPIDRFISGFTEKCVKSEERNFCHGCGTDIRCFLRKEYRRLMRISMLFPVYTVADTHFAPQTWFCDMKRTLKSSTVIRYSNGNGKEKMIDDFLSVFRSKDVPESDLNVVKNELSLQKTRHATSGSLLRQQYEKLLREDAAIRKALIRLYYYDFLHLDYPM